MVAKCLVTNKFNNDKFTPTFDECTSLQNKRYINIIIHSKETFWSLGLVRVSGIFSAENFFDVISMKLNEFGGNLESDIVAISL